FAIRHVDDAVVLNRSVLANPNVVDIPTQHRTKPNGRARPNLDVPDHHCGLGNENLCSQLGVLAPIGPDHCNVLSEPMSRVGGRVPTYTMQSPRGSRSSTARLTASTTIRSIVSSTAESKCRRQVQPSFPRASANVST